MKWGHCDRRRVLAAGAAFVLAAGCSLFETRDATEPGNGNGVEQCPFTDAVDADITLRNMEQAFGCGASGSDNYRRTLAPDFEFVVDELADQGVKDVIASWAQDADKAVEAFSQQMGAASDLSATLVIVDSTQADDGQGGIEFRDSVYTLVFTSSGDTVSRFFGKANIFVEIGGGGDWEMYRWEDIDQGAATISEFWVNGTTAGEEG